MGVKTNIMTEYTYRFCRYLLKYFRKIWNASLAFLVLTGNLSEAHFYIFNFDRPTEISAEGKRLRYAEFTNLMIIPKGK